MMESPRTDRRMSMTAITLSASPKGNGYQATVTYPGGVSIRSAET